MQNILLNPFINPLISASTFIEIPKKKSGKENFVFKFSRSFSDGKQVAIMFSFSDGQLL